MGAQDSPVTPATNLYTNPTHAFSCKIPAGWVLRTDEMNAGTDGDKGQVLLAAFERPPDAAGDAVNSTILIATENQSTYPGLKNPEDYFAPLTEIVTAQGFKVVNEPYVFPVSSKSLVRADFARENAGAKNHVAAYQSTLVMLSHGAIISFTFIAGNEGDADDLIENLTFLHSAKSRPKTAPEKKAK